MSSFDGWWLKEWGQFGNNFSEYSKEDMEGAYDAGMERAAEMLELNYPLCARWIRKEIVAR